MRHNHYLIVPILLFFATIMAGCGSDEGDQPAGFSPHKREALFQHYETASLGAALSPEGYYAMIGTGKTYPVLWDLVQQQELYKIEDPIAEDAYIYKFSQDSRYVVVAGKDRASVWHVETGKKYGAFKLADEVTAVDLSQDGLYSLLGTYDGAVFFIHNPTGKLIRKFVSPNRIESVSLSPNGLFVATADDYRTVRIWRMANGKLIHKIRMKKPVNHVLISNQYVIILCAQGGMYSYSVVSGKLLHQFKYPRSTVSSAIISGSNKYLVTANMPNKINIWDVRTAALLQSLKVRQLSSATTGQRYVLSIAFNEHQREIYIEDAHGYMEILPVPFLMSDFEKKEYPKKSFIDKEILPGGKEKKKTKKDKLQPMQR